MAGHIYPKTIRGRVYYYYQKTYREKIAAKDSGKTKGSGESRVRTESVYLGSADSILKRLSESDEPLEVRHRDFGFVAAVYQTAAEIGLVDMLKNHIDGERFGIPRWVFFLLTIINRLGHATSKERMGKWAGQTVLPELLGFDPKRLNSKTFWCATDDVISEKELREAREKSPELEEDICVGLNDDVFRTIEEELFVNLRDRFALSAEAVFYDTTNFFTYIEEPARSKLARAGHNKDCHHHLKQVGLAMCVEKEWGIPLFHRIYRGNSQDSHTFSELVVDLIDQMKRSFDEVGELVLVLDKGNNSEANFAALKGKINWVGSLVPSHFKGLLEKPLKEYTANRDGLRFFRLKREVMGVECALVVTYNSTLARKQEHSLSRGIENLKKKVRKYWRELKRAPRKTPAGALSLIKKNRYGKFLNVQCEKGQPKFTNVDGEIAKQHIRFGKRILFSDKLNAESEWIIRQYKAKDIVEDGFKLLKAPELIRFRPGRHWTDTKIRAFGFCCVMALVLIRVMQRKAELANIRMSPYLLKEELADLKQVIMLYSAKRGGTKITHRSAVQNRLWELFDLGAVEELLTIHKAIR